MPTLLEFFTLERLIAAGATKTKANTIRNALRNAEPLSDPQDTGYLRTAGGGVRTIEQLLNDERGDALIRTDRIQDAFAGILLKAIEQAGLQFRYQQYTNPKAFRNSIRRAGVGVSPKREASVQDESIREMKLRELITHERFIAAGFDKNMATRMVNDIDRLMGHRGLDVTIGEFLHMFPTLEILQKEPRMGPRIAFLLQEFFKKNGIQYPD